MKVALLSAALALVVTGAVAAGKPSTRDRVAGVVDVGGGACRAPVVGVILARRSALAQADSRPRRHSL